MRRPRAGPTLCSASIRAIASARSRLPHGLDQTHVDPELFVACAIAALARGREHDHGYVTEPGVDVLLIPMRPNGRKGWVRRSALGPLYRVQTLLVVIRSKLGATLYRRGRPIWKAPVGIGKPSTPTPAGHFWIREKFRTPGSGGLYGPVAFGTSDYSVLSDWPGGGIIGIHGTNEASLIPGRPSHGCIRVRDQAVRRLWRLMPIGTPLLIR